MRGAIRRDRHTTDFFISSNNLTGDEILELPRVREAVTTYKTILGDTFDSSRKVYGVEAESGTTGDPHSEPVSGLTLFIPPRGGTFRSNGTVAGGRSRRDIIVNQRQAVRFWDKISVTRRSIQWTPWFLRHRSRRIFRVPGYVPAILLRPVNGGRRG